MGTRSSTYPIPCAIVATVVVIGCGAADPRAAPPQPSALPTAAAPPSPASGPSFETAPPSVPSMPPEAPPAPPALDPDVGIGCVNVSFSDRDRIMLLDITERHTGLSGGWVARLHMACDPAGCSGTVFVVAGQPGRELATSSRLLKMPAPTAQALFEQLRERALDATPDPPGRWRLSATDDYRDIDIEIHWPTGAATFHLTEGTWALRGGRTCRFTIGATERATEAYERFSEAAGVPKLVGKVWQSAGVAKVRPR